MWSTEQFSPALRQRKQPKNQGKELSTSHREEEAREGQCELVQDREN